jgi:FkbM family methyltransferase
MPTTIPIMLRMINEHPANQGRRARAFVRMAAWQAYKRTIRRPFSLRVYENSRFRCYPDSTQPGRFLYFGGLPDYEEMLFMQRYLRAGDHVVDCGANAGMYTILAAELVGRAGRVDAFEGAPSTVERLRENVALNGLDQVVVHVAAVSDREGDVEFTTDRGSGTGNRMRTSEDAAEATAVVPAVRLDDAIGEASPALVKLDIEGAEPLAFVGAQELLRRRVPPVWLLELQDRYMIRYGWTAERLVELLDGAGYQLATYDPTANELHPGGYELVHSRMDLFAVARDKLDYIGSRLAGETEAGVGDAAA